MSEKLDQTQKLGDVFLAQQKEVLNAIQRLRAKAEAAGNLKTTQEQKVIVEEKIIKIEPANPQVDLCSRPTIRRWFMEHGPIPPIRLLPGILLVTSLPRCFPLPQVLPLALRGVTRGEALTGVGERSISTLTETPILNTHINRDQAKQNLQARGQREGGAFQHDPGHRKGVGYRDDATAQKFNRGTDAQAAKAREDFRGRAEGGRQELASQGGPGDRGGLGEKGGLGDRGGLGDKGGPGDRARLGDKGGPGIVEAKVWEIAVLERVTVGVSGRELELAQAIVEGRGGGGGGSAFQGAGGRGGDVRSASARGAASRGGSASRGGGGGGGRRWWWWWRWWSAPVKGCR